MSILDIFKKKKPEEQVVQAPTVDSVTTEEEQPVNVASLEEEVPAEFPVVEGKRVIAVLNDKRHIVKDEVVEKFHCQFEDLSTGHVEASLINPSLVPDDVWISLGGEEYGS